MFLGLRFYLMRTPVLHLAATVAVAQVVVTFITNTVSGFLIVPLVYPPVPGGSSSSFTFTFFGDATLFGRTVYWLSPVRQLLTLLIVAGLAAKVRSARRSPRAPCPFCLVAIPVEAAVCFNCARDTA